jgi:hypothetical protein
MMALQQPTLADRVRHLSQEAWKRRGSLAQVALGSAKLYAAWELYQFLPEQPRPDRVDNALISLDPIEMAKGLSWMYLVATSLCHDIVHGGARAWSGHRSDVFLPLERGLYLVYKGKKI